MSSPCKRKKPETPDIPEWMKRSLECPVCLEIIMDPPIFICENPQAHSLCYICHESLKKDGKTCPVCRREILDRRNVTLESMLDSNPNKVKCKFDDCDFKRLDRDALKKHEDECENRYVPCAYCDDKIGQKELAEHIIQKHCDGKQLSRNQYFGVLSKGLLINSSGMNKNQGIFSVTNDVDDQKFVKNWFTVDEVTTLFWMAYIGAKDLASNYKYTLQVRRSKARKNDYVFDGTRDCVPCDLSHEDVKKRRCALMLERELIDNATKDEGKLHYHLTIHKA